MSPPRLLLLLALIGLLLFLSIQFPYALHDENTRPRALYLIIILALGVIGVLRGVRLRSLPKMARDAAIWLGIVLALVVFYSFRDEFMHSRLMAELLPNHVQVNGDGTLEIRASLNGHFMVEASVNGVPVRFMIDTGASNIVLTPDDAERIGLKPSELAYDHFYSTANGTGKGASATLHTLAIGNVTLKDIPASVNQVWMEESLLGMSFLKNFSGFRVEGNRLLLVP